MSDVTETQEPENPTRKFADEGGNLRRLQKGETANPAGRKKGSRNRRTIIREILDNLQVKGIDLNTGEETDNLIPVAERITLAQVVKAMSGDTNAFRELMDGGFGKVADKVKNEVTFKQMGRVTAARVGDPPAAPVIEGHAVEVLPEPAKELTFDIGSTPPDPNAEELGEREEGEGDDEEQGD